MDDSTTIKTELLKRRERMQTLLHDNHATDQLLDLLREVDSALERIDKGTYGICEYCHEEIEDDYLHADPLVRICLSHLNDAEQRVIEHDLELAARVQGKLLPSCNILVDGWELCYHYEPHGIVGGDYCDFIRPEKPGDDLYFFLGDVSGKGVSASLLVFHLHGMFRSLVSTGMKLIDMVEQANRLFSQSTLSSVFATLVCGRASMSGEIELCNAGHCPPLVVQNGTIRSVERSGLPLGVSFSAKYESVTLTLSADDVLFLYSDGLTETFNPAKEEYSEARLAAFIAKEQSRAPEDLINACLDDLARFRAGTPKSDDLTIMAMKRLLPKYIE